MIGGKFKKTPFSFKVIFSGSTFKPVSSSTASIIARFQIKFCGRQRFLNFCKKKFMSCNFYWLKGITK